MSVRHRLRTALLGGVNRRIDRLEARLTQRLDALETRLHESRDDTWSRSRERWRAAQPTPNLTWDVELTGSEFIAKAERFGAFGPDRRVVEIGPGYGRLLDTALRRGLEFESWTGVDLSERNVAFLDERFGRNGISFVHGDAEQVSLPRAADAVLSSLTFKHLFPSFQEALRNLGSQLRDGGLVIFDLIEGHRRYFEDDEVTYIRWYSREEVDEILGEAGLERVAFDEVRHHPDVARLLVVARKPTT